MGTGKRRSAELTKTPAHLRELCRSDVETADEARQVLLIATPRVVEVAEFGDEKLGQQLNRPFRRWPLLILRQDKAIRENAVGLEDKVI